MSNQHLSTPIVTGCEIRASVKTDEIWNTIHFTDDLCMMFLLRPSSPVCEGRLQRVASSVSPDGDSHRQVPIPFRSLHPLLLLPLQTRSISTGEAMAPQQIWEANSQLNVTHATLRMATADEIIRRIRYPPIVLLRKRPHCRLIGLSKTFRRLKTAVWIFQLSNPSTRP